MRAPQLRALETYWYLRLVAGTYRMEARPGATVAMKVTDMLGEEVLVTGQP